MSVYKNTKSGKWYCKFQIKGERKHLLCDGATNKQEALSIEDSEKFRLRQQQVGLLPREESKLTVGKLVNIFLDYSKMNKKSYEQDKYRLDLLLDKYLKANQLIKEMKPIDIENLKKRMLADNKTKVNINRYLELLSKMFNIAIDNDWLEKNPIKRNAKFPVKNYKVRYLSEDEEKKLFKHLPEEIKPIVITALNTGLRKQNILDLKWDDINFDFGYIEILENKGNKHIKIPMTETLKMMFKGMKHESEYIFLNPQTKKPYKDFRRLWNKAKENAGIENFRFHDLRHTVATRLAKNNIPITTIKEILSHSDVSTTMRYSHAVSSDETKAIDVLNSYN